MIRKLALGTAAGTGVAGALYYTQTQRQPPPPITEPKKRLPKYELPTKVKYLLIGGGASSFGACRGIRAVDPKAQVLIVGREDYLPYMKAPLSKEMWKSGADKDRLLFKQWNGDYRSILFEKPDYFANLDSLKQPDERRVAFVGGLSAVKVDPVEQKVFFDDGSSISYEQCLITSGTEARMHPKLANLPGIEKHLLTVTSVEDFKKLQQSACEDESIAVLGSGTVASELAYSMSDFAKRSNAKLKVTQIFPEAGNLSSMVPEYLAKWLTKQLISEGINVIAKADIASAEIVAKKLHLHLTSGQRIVVDKVVLADDLRPDVKLAKASGLEIDPQNGGIVVNSELAARSNLYVAGDASSFFDPRLGRRRFEGHEHAVSTGTLAGRNMAGARKPFSKQTLMWSDIGEIVNLEGIGLLDPSLKTVSAFFPDSPEENTDFEGKITKGVVFYKNDADVVVGILLCNVFGKASTARRIISEQKPSLDLKEVAKLFYEKYSPEEEPEEATIPNPVTES
ncbi:apoptosis-inducing factor 1, mitochondrial [Galendromus occidentalis]|uniref:Apoptosis-inducing factor 1, mitochondrial n=1 Tax=Galendromus occidentalis TaxID=34638 RepID=A0AAJ7L649_9ACAR|nr:apoptosis-inducing factor 1, mitochondrial [Galendromus occidentalis]